MRNIKVSNVFLFVAKVQVFIYKYMSLNESQHANYMMHIGISYFEHCRGTYELKKKNL